MATPSAQPATSLKHSFFSLPPELRIHIYQYLVHPDDCIYFEEWESVLYQGLYLSCSRVKDEIDAEIVNFIVKKFRETYLPGDILDVYFRPYLPLPKYSEKYIRVELSMRPNPDALPFRNSLRMTTPALSAAGLQHTIAKCCSLQWSYVGVKDDKKAVGRGWPADAVLASLKEMVHGNNDSLCKSVKLQFRGIKYCTRTQDEVDLDKKELGLLHEAVYGSGQGSYKTKDSRHCGTIYLEVKMRENGQE